MSTITISGNALNEVLNLPHEKLNRQFNSLQLKTFYGDCFKLSEASLSDILDHYDGDIKVIEHITLTNFEENLVMLSLSLVKCCDENDSVTILNLFKGE